MSEAAIPTRVQQPNPMLQLIPFALLPLGGAMIFALGIAMGARRDDIWILGLAIVTGIICILPLAIDRLRALENRQLVLAFISLAFFMSFVMPTYTEYYLHDGEMTGLAGLVGVKAPDIVQAQIGALLGIVSLLVGFWLPVGAIIANILPRPRRDWNYQESISVALIIVPMGLSIAVASQFGIIPPRLGSGVLSGIAGGYNVGIALLAIVWFRQRSRAAILVLLILVPPVMGLSFFTGSKQLFLTPLIMVAFAHILLERQIRAFWIVGGIVAIVLLYPLAHFYRDFVAMGDRLSALDVLMNPGRAFSLMSEFMSRMNPTMYLTAGLEATGNRFNSLGIAAIIFRDTPGSVPFQGGWSIGYIFLAFVPRIVWADKPVITALGQWVTDNYGPGPHITSHTAPSWIGEFYLNFGFPGVLIGCMALGIIFRVIQSYIFQGKATTPMILGGVVIVSGLALSVEKSLVVTLNSAIFNVLPIVMAQVGIIALSPGRRRMPGS